MPMMGRDWSHEGISGLFSNIEKNGYQMVYLTARAIGQVLLLIIKFIYEILGRYNKEIS